jgi:hypothetical protein
MTTGIPCFQYVSQTDVILNYVQLVGQIWMQFNKRALKITILIQKRNNYGFM